MFISESDGGRDWGATYSLRRRIWRTCRRGWHAGTGRPREPSSLLRHGGRIFVFSGSRIRTRGNSISGGHTVESERTSYATRQKKCEIAALQAERDRSINSPCATSTNLSSAPGSWFLSGWYLRLRRLYAFLMSCSDADLSTVARNQSSRILLPKLERTKRTVKDFVQVCRTDKYSTHEEGEKKKEWVDSHLAGLEHGQDERRQDT